MKREKIVESLSLLGKRLEIVSGSDIEPINLVVIGGSSLIVTGLASRPTTRDVDVVCLLKAHEDGTFRTVYGEPLPPILIREAEQVARDLGLDADWLNPGPANLLEHGLPKGMPERLIKMEFGKNLTVFFASRLDQIHFKVYASVDSGPGRHVEDLMALKPKPEEMKAAAEWALEHDPSETFKETLKTMLEQLGYGQVADTI